ncbi:hypothetical protein [Azotobacter salinestris]|uniref:hypothetical protein n=1 Tax=Azotobacter salinestris TaxID=69964 RepID=UPI001266A00A|nr:hypothetical protein [Azotobacter salinestris]
MGESKKSKIILRHFIGYISFSFGVAIFAIAMLWLLDFYMFDRHRLVVSNTSGSDVEILSASVNGVVIRDEVVFVEHNSKPHFSSTDYSEFKLRSKAGRFDVALTLRERGGGLKSRTVMFTLRRILAALFWLDTQSQEFCVVFASSLLALLYREFYVYTSQG